MAQAMAIIAGEGLDRLSLREVARRLGVSHQAPYKHYPSRDHLLAEVVRRAFDDFARFLDSRPASLEAEADLHAMGRAYMAYALERPLQYRLMFGTRLPEPGAHPAMLASARHAFGLLREALRRRAVARGGEDEATIDLDALYIWSTLHGLATLLRSEVVPVLDLAPGTQERAPDHVLQRIGTGLT